MKGVCNIDGWYYPELCLKCGADWNREKCLCWEVYNDTHRKI